MILTFMDAYPIRDGCVKQFRVTERRTPIQHPTSMAILVLNLIRDSDPKPFHAICSTLGDGSGYEASTRRFADHLEIVKALNDVGIGSERYDIALNRVLTGEQGSLDIDQNEAQKLGVLQTDTSE